MEEKKGRIVAVLGGHGDVEAQAHCKPDGVVSLKAVAISGFLTVRVPRVWDNPERREAERGPRDDALDAGENTSGTFEGHLVAGPIEQSDEERLLGPDEIPF